MNSNTKAGPTTVYIPGLSYDVDIWNLRTKENADHISSFIDFGPIPTRPRSVLKKMVLFHATYIASMYL